MTGRWTSLYWKIVHGGGRLLAFLLMVGSLVAALGIAMQNSEAMGAALKWGLVILMIVVAFLSLLALRAPSRRP